MPFNQRVIRYIPATNEKEVAGKFDSLFHARIFAIALREKADNNRAANAQVVAIEQVDDDKLAFPQVVEQRIIRRHVTQVSPKPTHIWDLYTLEADNLQNYAEVQQ